MQVYRKQSLDVKCKQEPLSHSSQSTAINPNLLGSGFYQINTLNRTLPQYLSLSSELPSIFSHSMLPLITKKLATSDKNLTTTTLERKANMLIKNSINNVISQSQTSKNQANHKNTQIQKTKKIRTRIFHQPLFFLSKDQRYFQQKKIVVKQENVQKLGLYESTNLFKTKNVQQYLSQLKIIAEKPDFNPIKLISKNDIFLTNIFGGSNAFSLQNFIEEQLKRDKQCEKVVANFESTRLSKELNQTQIKFFQKQEQIQLTPIYITFKHYGVLQDHQYKLLKLKHFQNWGNILHILKNICNCLKQYKIMHFIVKQDRFFLWEGKKIQKMLVKDILNLPKSNLFEKVQKILLAFRDKLKVAVMKSTLQHKQNLARWVVQRLKTKFNLRIDKQLKIKKAKSLQNKWINHNCFNQVQLRIPSFSVQFFKRNTTQYMQSFQALYHSLWEPSETPLILVLPTINQNLLKILQSRIKIKRPMTIITPELHEVYPKNLSLISQINLSYDTLNKIQKAISGKQAVLYTGTYDEPRNQLLLSEYLNIPLSASLNTNSISQQKYFFQTIGFANNPFCIIQPNSTFQDLLQKFSELILSNFQDKQWVFKIENEFRGRGIATFRFKPSKNIVSKQAKQINRVTFKQSLRSMLRLKLKINFQNTLYMVEDYLTSFLKKGGVIQQLSTISNTYQICFKKEASCELLSIFKIFGIYFANKVWLSTSKSAQLTPIISRIQTEIQKNDFLGYLSVTIAQRTTNQFFGIDIKFGQTPSSNLTSYIKMLQRKRTSIGSEAFNLIQLPTKRTQRDEAQNHSQSSLLNEQSFRYLFIPTFPFTDVNLTTKSLLIQELMNDCWNKRKLKITDEGLFYFSLGLDFSALVVSKQIKKLKKMGIEMVRDLTDKTSSLKEYRGKQVIRDVFQYGDVIRAISRIKNDD